MTNIIDELNNGLNTAFIDSSNTSSLAYKPSFVSNDSLRGKKVLTAIENELMECDKFQISVAFITLGGIEPLKSVLKELENKNIKGEILTTNYLNFSQPDALETLHSLKNITLKMYDVNKSNDGLHTKGYIFKSDEIYRIIIGSSNMTSAALTTNKEWNTKIVSTENGEIAKEILSEFNSLWNSESAIDYDDFIDNYREAYRISLAQRNNATRKGITQLKTYKLKPNSMQVGFIKNLKDLINENADKALLISATGTGKTYASAFAMRELGYNRVLFLVHRNQIAKQAKASYERVYGNSIKTGLVSGADHGYDADFVFATVQTLSKDEHLRKFPKDYFECCIYDEAHHTSAGSYKKIMEYFTPSLALGMTATPDKREDNIEGRNIYEIFDHNIACEIRLQQAMEDNLLCPFHYFGITELEYFQDNSETGELQEELSNFRYLTCEERVKYVMQNAEYYGYSGSRVKGLLFCSRIEEGKELSKKFNEQGLKTVFLSGSDSENYREKMIELLVKDLPLDENGKAMKDNQEYLDYIITVDIFSEGTDIVECNQVIMLRPTQSPIVFIQQLGRGLRKADNKEFVVVLDFIGNYNNNFMIPIALSGDRTYNKDNVRRYLIEGSKIIPGASSIHFDKISKKKIFESIDNANFSNIKLIKENYTNLKNKLGRIPKLKDFDDYGEIDILKIFDSSAKSYYNFLVKYEKDYNVRLSEKESKTVEFISKKFANGKRIHELELLNIILSGSRNNLISELVEALKRKYGINLSENQKINIANIMSNNFQTGTGKNTYKECVLLKKDGTDYKLETGFEHILSNKDFADIMKELVEFGISRYLRDYSNRYKDTDFVLYNKYTYEDVCRLLAWENNFNPNNIGGYIYEKNTKTLPVFINYQKEENAIAYEDRFVSENKLIALSKHPRKITSPDADHIYKRTIEDKNNRIFLFVRKNKDDKGAKEFYFLGEIYAQGEPNPIKQKPQNDDAFEITYSLDSPVRSDIYDYIVQN